MVRRLELRFEDRPSVEKALDREWRNGGAFVRGAGGLPPFAPCELVIVLPEGGALAVDATVVASEEDQAREGGVRLLLDAGVEERLSAFVSGSGGDTSEGSAASPTTSETSDNDAPDSSRSISPRERLSQLSYAQQQKLARTSQSLTERTTLERMLDRAGWQELLLNPYITPPEVARLARKGTVPRPLLELIVSNAQWTRDPIVRRALLTNPKLTAELVQKVLRMTPAYELKLVPKQTAYPELVRTLATKMLGR